MITSIAAQEYYNFYVTNKFPYVQATHYIYNGMSTANRLQALHKRLGITLSDLSTEARNALEDMVDLAIALDLKDCSFTRSENKILFSSSHSVTNYHLVFY